MRRRRREEARGTLNSRSAGGRVGWATRRAADPPPSARAVHGGSGQAGHEADNLLVSCGEGCSPTRSARQRADARARLLLLAPQYTQPAGRLHFGPPRRNGGYGSNAVATYNWAVRNVGAYVGGAITARGVDPLLSSYGIAHLAPSTGGGMGRMQMWGSLKNVAAYDELALTSILQWMCAGTAQVALVTGERLSAVCALRSAARRAAGTRACAAGVWRSCIQKLVCGH